MSHSTLYMVFKTTVREIGEFENSYGTALPLWDFLAKTYLGWGDGWSHQKTPEEDKALWRLARDPQVPRALRICHAMTFDNALVVPSDIQAAADACEFTYGVVRQNSPGTNHWHRISARLKRFKTSDQRVIGVALNCTSVNDIWGTNQCTQVYDLMKFIDRPL